MKKQINSVSSWSVKGIITITILSAMLCTFSANANNKPSVASNTTGVEISANSIESINETIEKYNAAEFVQADMANEIDSWMNSNDEYSDLLIGSKYQAAEFVQADMALEIDSWMNNSGI